MNSGFTIAGAKPDYAPDLALEPVHVEIRLSLEIGKRRAGGGVTTTVRCNRNGARSLRLDAIGMLDVAVNGPETWRYDGEGIDLTWDQPFAAGEERTVEVLYALEDPVSGLHFSAPDEAYPQEPFFVCSDNETERARYWLPCVDRPSVRPTYDFFLTAPSDLTILANGRHEGDEDHGDTKTAHWRLSFPCPSYLCCFAAGRFSRHVDETVGEIPVEYYAAERIDPEWLKLTFGRTPAMLRWITQRLGVAFPFRKYVQLALPGIGGAMENISLVTWDETLVQDETLHPELGMRVDSVNVHEMAHSYFGDAVVCRHFEHSWLKESWATYIETVWREDNFGADEAHYNLHLDAAAYTTEADSKYVRPLVTRTYNASFDLFDAHLYPGGAWRLHMLRRLVGDETFWAATKDYLETYSRKVVETADFRRIMEAHSGLNLVPFFDQWIHAKGYPKLKATFKPDTEKCEAKLVVEQTQVDDKQDIGIFKLPLEVEYTDDDGAHRVTLELDAARASTLVKLKGKCTLVRIDPDCHALFALDFNPGDDLLKAALTGAGDIRNRIRAAAELIKTGTRSNLRAVRDAMAKEPFYGVRREVATALGKSGHAAAIEPLATLLASEQDPRVQGPLADACGKLRDPRLRDALAGFLEADRAPYATMAALGALGAQRDERDIPTLESAADQDGLHKIVARGALAGLGAQRALKKLEGRMPYGAESLDARHFAVTAYGQGAAACDLDTRRRAAELLIDLTRDPQLRTRMQAGAALAGLGISAAIPALESLKKLESNQDLPRIERWIQRLRKGRDGEETSKLREQFEKLEEKHRKLEERIQDLEAKEE